MVLLLMGVVQDMLDIVLPVFRFSKQYKSTTYSIEWRVHSGTTYLNRTWDSGWFHGASSVTAMEVSA